MSGGWTKGEWFLTDNPAQVSDKHFWFDADGSRHGDTPNMLVAFDSLADAKLFHEAGTVANETGLTPRQLADQNKELLAALAPFAEIQTGFAEYLSKEFERAKIKVADVQLARAVIAKCAGAA